MSWLKCIRLVLPVSVMLADALDSQAKGMLCYFQKGALMTSRPSLSSPRPRLEIKSRPSLKWYKLSTNESETKSRRDQKPLKILFEAKPLLQLVQLATFVHCTNDQDVFFKKKKKELLLVKQWKTILRQTNAQNWDKAKQKWQ